VTNRIKGRSGPAPEDVDRRQTAAEEKLRESTSRGEGADPPPERDTRSGKHRRSYRTIDNPLRSNQIDRQKTGTKYDERDPRETRVEEALIAAKSEWEKEKLNLVNEAMKHRAARFRAERPRAMPLRPISKKHGRNCRHSRTPTPLNFKN